MGGSVQLLGSSRPLNSVPLGAIWRYPSRHFQAGASNVEQADRWVETCALY